MFDSLIETGIINLGQSGTKSNGNEASKICRDVYTSTETDVNMRQMKPKQLLTGY